MKIDKVTSGQFGRDPYVPFRTVPLRPVNRARTRASTGLAGWMTYTITTVSIRVCRVCQTLVGAPVRAITDKIIASAENAARAIIKLVDVTQQRRNHRD